VVRISTGSHQDLKNWNLLQSGQALGIMTAAGKLSNTDAIFVGELRQRPSACGREMGDVFNTLNKSLPWRSSKDNCCVVTVCSACNCVV